MDSDVMSMEQPQVFRECQLLNDRTALFQAARAIMQLQVVYGIIPRVTGKGEAAKSVADMLMRMQREQIEPSLVAPEIESVVILDRNVDCMTPLITQLT